MQTKTDDILKGTTLICSCKATATVEHKNELPTGWMILRWPETNGTHTITRCPACDAKELERWNP